MDALRARVLGHTGEEKKKLQELIELQPYKKENYYEMAECYFHNADVDPAINKYRDALKLEEQFPRAYNHLAYCYAWKGQHSQALNACNRYLELEPTANAYDSYGDIYMHAGEYAKAIEMKREAIRLQPDHYWASRNLAFINILQGRYKDAESALSPCSGKRKTPQRRRNVTRHWDFCTTGKGSCNEGEICATRD